MGMCFVPDCKHYSEKDVCHFFKFPKDPEKMKSWLAAIRRADREPSLYSVVCSCHFKDGKKENGPSIFARNEKKVMDFPETGTSRKKRLRTEAEVDALDAAPPPPSPPLQAEENSPSTSRPNNEVILEAEIYFLKREVEELKKNKTVNQRFNFEMIKNSDDLIILHTGLPNKEVFEYVLEICTDQDFKYCSGWAVTADKQAV
ncbi:THAP domain-containing protein 1-like [Nilaparvata lugens]|uniref:THAP domain-containing protein 1-like n=1 Tax=Nilaparvata lugens TaxID=108931 RepID=UPI00193CB124|nr:THAP domain-containing protein 1-like [Nilaparvata lugens]